MCMYMLQRRTNILFDDALWNLLASKARVTNRSVGDLVRSAIRQVYLSDSKRDRIASSIKTILTTRKTHRNINYKHLIDYGRKLY